MFSTTIQFDPIDRDNIVHYEYKSGKYTPIDNLLRKLTQLTIPYIPEWWSPNGITLFGFAMDVLGVLFLIFLNEEDGSSSRLACLLYAILASVYVYMDMLDGKQSRKLGCNSPIGQLFDHGCDSLNGSCLVFAAMRAIGLTDNHLMAILLGITGYVFITFQIIEYYQGVLMYGTALAGVTEVELLVILFNLISAWKGVAFWKTSITLMNISFTLQQAVVAIIIFGMGGMITLKNIKILCMGTQLDEKRTGNKNNSRVDHIGRFIPILFINLFLYYLSQKTLMNQHPKSILLIAALSISHYSITVNIHHICKKRLTWNFSGHCILFALCLLSAFAIPISSVTMAIFVILEFIIYFSFVRNVLSVMSTTLHIDVFGTKFKSE